MASPPRAAVRDRTIKCVNDSDDDDNRDLVSCRDRSDRGSLIAPGRLSRFNCSIGARYCRSRLAHLFTSDGYFAPRGRNKLQYKTAARHNRIKFLRGRRFIVTLRGRRLIGNDGGGGGGENNNDDDNYYETFTSNNNNLHQ